MKSVDNLWNCSSSDLILMQSQNNLLFCLFKNRNKFNFFLSVNLPCLGNMLRVAKPVFTTLTLKLCRKHSNRSVSNMLVAARISTQTCCSRGSNFSTLHAAATKLIVRQSDSSNMSRSMSLATFLSQQHWLRLSSCDIRCGRPNSFQVIFCAYGLC